MSYKSTPPNRHQSWERGTKLSPPSLGEIGLLFRAEWGLVNRAPNATSHSIFDLIQDPGRCWIQAEVDACVAGIDQKINLSLNQFKSMFVD